MGWGVGMVRIVGEWVIDVVWMVVGGIAYYKVGL